MDCRNFFASAWQGIEDDEERVELSFLTWVGGASTVGP